MTQSKQHTPANDGVTFSELVGNLQTLADGNLAGHIPASWMQGRTTYGGLSAALCLRATLDLYPDLPPLRSVLVNFVGPAGGDFSVVVTVLRQGKSVSTIRCELISEGKIATHAVFSFGASRDSRLNQSFTIRPNMPSVEQSTDFFASGPGPQFTSNFDCRLAQGASPITGSDISEHFIWTRHKDVEALDLVALIGLADMPPPAVLPMFKEFAPISSMTWMINILSQDLSTQERWWLMRTAAENAQDGYSSQDMQVWNGNGDLVISGRQSVAIFY